MYNLPHSLPVDLLFSAPLVAVVLAPAEAGLSLGDARVARGLGSGHHVLAGRLVGRGHVLERVRVRPAAALLLLLNLVA